MANETSLERLAKLGVIDDLAAAAASKIAEVEEKIPTKTSELQNDSTYQTAEQVTAAIGSQLGRVYKPVGTVEFSALPALTEALLGNVYNISDGFTTDDRFAEGAGKTYPAGTNVAVVQDGETYKFDVLSGAVDLSGYVQKETGKGLSSNDFTNDDVAKLSGVATGATKVEASTTAGKIKINGEETTVIEVASDEEAAAVINAHFPPTV